MQIIVEFEKDKLWVNKLNTNIRKPRNKRKINISTKEYDIRPLVIESNAYIIDQETNNVKKLAQEKDRNVNRLKKEMKQIKKPLQEFEELGTDKEDLKLKFKKDCELDERIEKLIENFVKIFPKAYHDLVYLDGIDF